MQSHSVERRQLLLGVLGSASIAGLVLNPSLQRAIAAQEPTSDSSKLTADQIANASWIVDAKLTPEQCELIATELNAKLASLTKLHENPPLEDVPMPLAFLPSFFADPKTSSETSNVSSAGAVPTSTKLELVELPAMARLDDIVDWNLQQLASGLRKGLFSSVQLTEFYLNRLKKANDRLLCVVNYNNNAMVQAEERDKELAAGRDRGILHGIPWGAKDIIAIPGLPTTWGAGRYADRTWNQTATVADKLLQAGGVLLAKLSVGTLAWGDEWHGGTTKNPWNTNQGSSGSSAGSASAVAARLCPFALGSETLGSIVSPTRVCATSGLRPTFGRVSRAGCMTLAWSMDKIGPIANRVEDCATVFRVLLGCDGLDPTVVERPFSWPVSIDLKGLKFGVASRLSRSEQFIRDWLLEQGAVEVPIQWETSTTTAMMDALSVEAASVHEKLFRTATEDKELGKWGPSFRTAQWVRAIDYLHGMRQRVALIQETEQKLCSVDVLLGDGGLARMNMTGHPSLVVAYGKEPRREPPKDESPGSSNEVRNERRENATSEKPNTIVLTGRMFSESTLLALGVAIQKSHPAIPSTFVV